MSLLLPERESSGMSAEVVVQGHGAVRTVGLAASEPVTGDREDACSISAVGDNGVSSDFSGDCTLVQTDAVSDDV